MLSTNPFSILAETVSPIFMQMFIIVMALFVIVGTLLEVGLRKIPAKQIKTILEQRDRNMAGKTSPAAGLYFIGARYKRKFKLPSLLNSDI